MVAVVRESISKAARIDTDNGARRLRITWEDGHQSAYPYIWLRHDLFHPAAGRPEQSADSPCVSIEDATQCVAESVEHVDGMLKIHWSHDHSNTRHSLSWLRDNCVSEAARDARRGAPRLWSKHAAERFEWFAFAELEDPSMRMQLFRQLRDFGLGLVHGLPRKSGQVRELARWFGPIRVTHFGELFDIRSTPEDQSGTGAGIGATQSTSQAPHTDESWRHSPPGLSFFHCLQPSPGGGGASLYVDGIAAAERLRARQPRAFDLLTSVPILFTAERNPQERFRARGRMIATDMGGVVRGVRVTDRTMPPLDLPEALIEPAYQALAAFNEELYDLSHAFERVLQPGECVIFDNHRVLHARRAFDRQAGERWLQQVSVDREEFHNLLIQLAETLGLDEEARIESDGGVLVDSLVGT